MVTASSLAEAVDRVAAETRFSGVVRVNHGDAMAVDKAYGSANRAAGVGNTTATRFAIASGSKALTALVVVSLVEDGLLGLTTPVRAILGNDLPLIDDDVTVGLLLGHRSGIGDYLDEDAGYGLDDYVMPVPVHELATTESYLRVLGGFPQKASPGERFSYCNSGYVVLALVAERSTGTSFYDLVEQRVCRPASMSDTAFLRSDELPERTAVGYLGNDGLRTNVFHLPVRGSGDGGVYSTAADIGALWSALFRGCIVSRVWANRMVQPLSHAPEQSLYYGLGFWVDARRNRVILEGSDAGVSFRSAHHAASGATYTVMSNTSRGAWPIARRLEELAD